MRTVFFALVCAVALTACSETKAAEPVSTAIFPILGTKIEGGAIAQYIEKAIEAEVFKIGVYIAPLGAEDAVNLEGFYEETFRENPAFKNKVGPDTIRIYLTSKNYRGGPSISSAVEIDFESVSILKSPSASVCCVVGDMVQEAAKRIALDFQEQLRQQEQLLNAPLPPRPPQ